jgi:hypothetical protein
MSWGRWTSQAHYTNVKGGWINLRSMESKLSVHWMDVVPRSKTGKKIRKGEKKEDI